jgi:PAS domain S-box-containing protein
MKQEAKHNKRPDAMRSDEWRLHSIFENSHAGCFFVDKEGIIRVVNDAWLRMMRYSAPNEIIGKHFSAVFSVPGELKKAQMMFASLLQGANFPSEEFTLHCHDGSVAHLLLSANPLKKEEKIFGVEGFLIDLTHRKRIEAELKESKERYRTLWEVSRDGILLLDMSRKIVIANAKALKMFGYGSNDEIIGKNYSDFIVENDHKKFTKKGESLLRNGGSKEIPCEIICNDGTLIPAEARETLTQGPEGEPHGSIIVIRDISEMKNLQAELLHIRGMNILPQVISGIAHEVRTPLNAILATVEALFQEIGEKAKYEEYMFHIRNQIERLSLLMKDLLELGKPVQSTFFQMESLVNHARAIVDLWNETSFSKTHLLRFLSPPWLEQVYIDVDSSRLQQVLFNLLHNAAQNSPMGSEILLQIDRPDEERVRITIQDRGCGIPVENFPKIFLPFFTTRKGGTGLGLCLARNFLQAIGGEITISNNDPHPGCKVEVILPAAKGMGP